MGEWVVFLLGGLAGLAILAWNQSIRVEDSDDGPFEEEYLHEKE